MQSFPCGDGKGEPALFERQRIARRTLAAPARRGREAVAARRRQSAPARRCGDQPRCDSASRASILAAHLQQHRAPARSDRAEARRHAPRAAASRSVGHRLRQFRAPRISRAPIVCSRPSCAREDRGSGRDVGLAARRMGGDLGERLVLHDAAARQVARLRLLLAPGGDLAHASGRGPRACGSELQIRRQASPDQGVGRRIGQHRHLLVDPAAAAGLGEPSLNIFVDGPADG